MDSLPKVFLGREGKPSDFIDGVKKEEMMKRKKMFAAIFLLSLFILSCATTHQVSTELIPDTAKIVKLTVPGCGWKDTAARVRDILTRIDGVYDVKADTTVGTATITFDPEKTNVAAFIGALKPEFIVKGEPVFIK